jgi:hypothetical protein
MIRIVATDFINPRKEPPMHSWDVIAYDYQADRYCETCITDIAADRIFELDPERVLVFTRYPSETLALWARLAVIDHLDEHSYDADDFPKVVFADQIEDDAHCGACHCSLTD